MVDRLLFNGDFFIMAKKDKEKSSSSNSSSKKKKDKNKDHKSSGKHAKSSGLRQSSHALPTEEEDVATATDTTAAPAPQHEDEKHSLVGVEDMIHLNELSEASILANVQGSTMLDASDDVDRCMSSAICG